MVTPIDPSAFRLNTAGMGTNEVFGATSQNFSDFVQQGVEQKFEVATVGHAGLPDSSLMAGPAGAVGAGGFVGEVTSGAPLSPFSGIFEPTDLSGMQVTTLAIGEEEGGAASVAPMTDDFFAQPIAPAAAPMAPMAENVPMVTVGPSIESSATDGYLSSEPLMSEGMIPVATSEVMAKSGVSFNLNAQSVDLGGQYVVSDPMLDGPMSLPLSAISGYSSVASAVPMASAPEAGANYLPTGPLEGFAPLETVSAPAAIIPANLGVSGHSTMSNGSTATGTNEGSYLATGPLDGNYNTVGSYGVSDNITAPAMPVSAPPMSAHAIGSGGSDSGNMIYTGPLADHNAIIGGGEGLYSVTEMASLPDSSVIAAPSVSSLAVSGYSTAPMQSVVTLAPSPAATMSPVYSPGDRGYQSNIIPAGAKTVAPAARAYSSGISASPAGTMKPIYSSGDRGYETHTGQVEAKLSPPPASKPLSGASGMAAGSSTSVAASSSASSASSSTSAGYSASEANKTVSAASATMSSAGGTSFNGGSSRSVKVGGTFVTSGSSSGGSSSVSAAPYYSQGTTNTSTSSASGGGEYFGDYVDLPGSASDAVVPASARTVEAAASAGNRAEGMDTLGTHSDAELQITTLAVGEEDAAFAE